MEKVLDMLLDERKREISIRGGSSNPSSGVCEPNRCWKTVSAWVQGHRHRLGEEGTIAHKNIDSRRVLGYGIDIEELNRVACLRSITPSICEVLVIDEIGKFSVESEAFVQAFGALEVDTDLAHPAQKSRHPLLQDIRRRDDGRILEVTGESVLLPYKIHKLMRPTEAHPPPSVPSWPSAGPWHAPTVLPWSASSMAPAWPMLGAGFGLQRGRLGREFPALELFSWRRGLLWTGWTLGNGFWRQMVLP